LDQGELFHETEAYMVAIQDGVNPTQNYQKYVMKTTNIQDECRKCGEKGEMVEHMISGCRKMVNEEYIKRHNIVAKVIHQKLVSEYQLIKEKVPTFKYEPDAVLENTRYRIMWDRSIITDKTIPANRPNIIATDCVNKYTYLIHIAVPGTISLEKTYQEKTNKYIELADEIRRIWNQKEVKIIPILVTATGIVPKNLSNSLKEIGLSQSVYIELQKQAVLETCHIVRKFMSQ
jgi:hypothetical protein